MLFLTASEAKKKIIEKLKTSEKTDLAVAFWGNGAIDELGLAERAHALRLICNLSVGGTNSAEIRKIQKAIKKRPGSGEVLQSDRLHAKVYLFQDCVIIGSSNASSNGLGFEGNELAHWEEANILSDDPNLIAEVKRWLDQLPVRPILDPDLEKAESLWRKRRQIAQIPQNMSRTVLEALRNEPEQFSRRKAYLLIYYEEMSSEALEAEEDLRIEYGNKDLGIFEDWEELPNEGVFLCFRATSRSFAWDHAWIRDPDIADRVLTRNKNTIHISWKTKDVFGLAPKSRTEAAEWRRICRKVTENAPTQDEAIILPLIELVNAGYIASEAR